MGADMGSSDAVLKERYTPEQRALADQQTKAARKPERTVTKHLPRRFKEKD